MAALVDNWPDLLDPRFKRIYNNEYKKLPDMVDTFFNMEQGKLLTERVSSAGSFGEMQQFTGSVPYDEAYQGYDVSYTHLPFAQGYMITRMMVEFDQHNIMDKKPSELANRVWYRRQTDASRPFNNATSVDTFFSTNSENVALASNSHTTTAPDVSTASGFDNLLTGSLNATNLASARVQMFDFRDDRGLKIAVMPDTLLINPSLYQAAFELIGSEKRPENANNAANVHYGQYRLIEWNFLDDTDNWALIDAGAMKRNGLVWSDKVKQEFDKTEDFDTIIAKWRTFAIWTQAWTNWRWLCYASVS
jgi:hypothetical protein